jgi:hypothetical protein
MTERIKLARRRTLYDTCNCTYKLVAIRHTLLQKARWTHTDTQSHCFLFAVTPSGTRSHNLRWYSLRAAASMYGVNCCRQALCTTQRVKPNFVIWVLLRFALFWDFKQRRMVASYRRFRTTFRSQLQASSSRYETIILRCVTPQKSADLSYTVAEAWSHAMSAIPPTLPIRTGTINGCYKNEYLRTFVITIRQ